MRLSSCLCGWITRTRGLWRRFPQTQSQTKYLTRLNSSVRACMRRRLRTFTPGLWFTAQCRTRRALEACLWICASSNIWVGCSQSRANKQSSEDKRHQMFDNLKVTGIEGQKFNSLKCQIDYFLSND